jgi:gluconate:H+ symporter, GntP family
MGEWKGDLMDPLLLLLIGMLIVLGGILLLKLHPFLALLLGALIVGGLTPESNLEKYAQSKNFSAAETQTLTQQSLGRNVASEFGRTCGKIGILIALAALIGKSLLESGAAERIVRSALKLFGEKRAPLSFLSTGFLLATPVYFDTVFYLMVPLAKAMGMRTNKNYALYVMAIIAGSTMAHSLVPPTPGPLFVAGELGISIGLMMLGGLVVGIFTSGSGYLYGLWANRKWPSAVRETADVSLEELKQLSEKEATELPPLWISLMPIVLPVGLIAGDTIFSTTWGKADPASLSLFQNVIIAFFDKVGDPNIALAISAAIGLGLLFRINKSKYSNKTNMVQSALASAGVIILITSAGGAFGAILQQTGIGPRIQELSSTYHVAVLPLAFFVTAVIRTAQGSATVAMITSVGILSGLVSAGGLGFHPLYLALVIGCGSKPIPWMNDSGFWIICKMSGFTEAENIKYFSITLTIMGFVGLAVVMILAKLFPLI